MPLKNDDFLLKTGVLFYAIRGMHAVLCGKTRIGNTRQVVVQDGNPAGQVRLSMGRMLRKLLNEC